MNRSWNAHNLFGTVWIVVLFVCWGGIHATELPADLEEKSIFHNGLKRSYFLHLPADYESFHSLPIVLALHGGGNADGDELAILTGYNAIADREGFIAVYPNGIDSQWNDGRGKSFRGTPDNKDVDDVGFLFKLIDHLIATYKGNPNQVYVTGLSNGGMMTLRLGCEISSKLTAIAPVIANLPSKILPECAPDSPLPVLVMNGTDDPIVPWNGGPVTIFGKSYGEVISTEQTIALWVKHNGCRIIPEVDLLPDKDPNDGSRVSVRRHVNTNDDREVILYAIVGGGHNFPGSRAPDLPRLIGNKNNDINGSEVIWEFFKRYTK